MSEFAIYGQSNRGFAIVFAGTATFFTNSREPRTIGLSDETGVTWRGAPKIGKVETAFASVPGTDTPEPFVA